MKNFPFFILLLFIFSSCNKADNDISSVIVEQEIEEVQSLISPTEDIIQARKDYPDVLGFPCISGGIEIDADCDGTYELGWNFVANSMEDCQCIIDMRRAHAESQEWCYDDSNYDCYNSICHEPIPATIC